MYIINFQRNHKCYFVDVGENHFYHSEVPSQTGVPTQLSSNFYSYRFTLNTLLKGIVITTKTLYGDLFVNTLRDGKTPGLTPNDMMNTLIFTVTKVCLSSEGSSEKHCCWR